MRRPDPAMREKAFIVLHDLKWTDKAIAKAFGLCDATVTKWRHAMGLPVAIQYNRIDEQQALMMVRSGSTDLDIADRMGVHQSAVVRWRQRRGLEANLRRRRLPEEDIRRARKMLRQGASKRQVADAIGCHPRTVQTLRKGMSGDGLRQTGMSDRYIRNRVTNDQSIFARIKRAIGKDVPEHIREEAVYDLYAAVFEGKVAIDQIEKRAPAFRSRAYDMCGSAYGPISLDAENEDGLSLSDIIADPDTLDWN